MKNNQCHEIQENERRKQVTLVLGTFQILDPNPVNFISIYIQEK